MGTGRRRSGSFSGSGRTPSHGRGGGGGGGGYAVDGYISSHVPASYTMPFGLPPPLQHRTQFSRDAAEFPWPAEPPIPHGSPQPYRPPAGAEDAAAAAAVDAARGKGEAAVAATVTAGAEAPAIAAAAAALAEVPRGSLLFGFGGVATAEAAATVRLAEHRALVDAEHLRLEYAMAAMDAVGSRTRRHWRRVSRLAEAEAWAGQEEEEEEEEEHDGGNKAKEGRGGGGGIRRPSKRAENKRSGGERLTGFHRNCQWKLGGNEHEGHDPGRFRSVLQPVVAAAQGSRYLASAQPLSSSFSSTSGGSGMSMEDVGLQLARKCSRYIVDIVKTENDGEGLADSAGAGGGSNASGDDLDPDDDDVWGIVGPLAPAAIIPDEENSKAGGEGVGGGRAGSGSVGFSNLPGHNSNDVDQTLDVDVVEEVSSSGETPAARVRREEEERRVVEERVRQATAAVASRGGASAEAGGRRGTAAGPKVDLGPGAERWRRAVAVAAEAVASATGVSEIVALVTPKGNIRGRLSLANKVGRWTS